MHPEIVIVHQSVAGLKLLHCTICRGEVPVPAEVAKFKYDLHIDARAHTLYRYWCRITGHGVAQMELLHYMHVWTLPRFLEIKHYAIPRNQAKQIIH
jgi:hypothetical protein